MDKIDEILEDEDVNGVPRPLLQKLSEVSNGGFFLIALNKDGDAVPYKFTDTPTHDLALQRAVEICCKQNDTVYENNFEIEVMNFDSEE